MTMKEYERSIEEELGLDGREIAFGRAVAAGVQQGQAYRDAGYDVSSDASARAAASRKRWEPKMVRYIYFLQCGDEGHPGRLDRDEKRRILAQIARGMVWDEAEQVFVKVSVTERMRAIDLDNGMTGDNAPQQVEVRGDLFDLAWDAVIGKGGEDDGVDGE